MINTIIKKYISRYEYKENIGFDKSRESVLFYVKIDLALIAAFATISTIFKFERTEVIQFLSSIKYVIVGLTLLACFGLILERKLASLIDFYTNESIAKNIKKIKTYLFLHKGVHITTFLILAFYAGTYADNYIGDKINDNARSEILKSANKFIDEKGRLPNDFDELLLSDLELEKKIRPVEASQIRYSLDAPKNHSLDSLVEADALIKEFYTNFYKVKKRNPKNLKEVELEFPEFSKQLKTIENIGRGAAYWLTLPGRDLKIKTSDDIVYRDGVIKIIKYSRE